MANKFFQGLFRKQKNDVPEAENSPKEGLDDKKSVETPIQTAAPAPQTTSEPTPAPAFENATPEDSQTPDRPPAGADRSMTMAERAPDQSTSDALSAALTTPNAGQNVDAIADAQPAAAPPATQEPEKPVEPEKKGWFSRLKDGLSRSSSKLSDGVTSIFTKRKLDDDALEELEELLITADLGVAVAAKDRFDKEVTDKEVRGALADIVAEIMAPLERPLTPTAAQKPFVLLMTGVNGAGKTTTIGKLAAQFKSDGKSVMLAAGDTFRAAAIEQLTAWGARTDTPVISSKVGADAAGLAFDALKAAKEAGTDILMIDTAGRLQNRSELMDELAKIVRVIKKLDPDAPHATLLVLDATVGQNAISQAQTFKEIADVSGLIMTKLDGTARGGVLVALAEKFALPIHYVGVGEGVDDLQRFNAKAFCDALTGATQMRDG